MEDISQLNLYMGALCKTLNDNGFRQKLILNGEPRYIDYKLDRLMPDLTVMHITSDVEAFQFLTSKGLIRNDICHFCGEAPIDGRKTFIEPSHKIAFSICNHCYAKGIPPTKIDVRNTGCLVTLFFVTLTIILLRLN
ncbi:hypothetical protein [Runella aurantiaca]|uniref:Uncharacterized protein n=1 Tax=Runella aurantiaca TaxID=2282308 RepID=A0A369IJV3_9BACT|nr:hypothetical protein [Runella aurantiaca]RDB06906.1 hypothetical protein DVG78_06395 [Runella aurantiaca]